MTASPIPRTDAAPRRLRIVDPLEPYADRLAAEFTERYGRRPDVVVAAPATVTLLGGPDWWDGGSSLSVAVHRAALAAVEAGPTGPVAVLTHRDFPAGAGLGSRAAERVAVRHALALLGREDRLAWSRGERAARWGRPAGAVLLDATQAQSVTADLTGFSLLALDTRQRHLAADAGLRDRLRALRGTAADRPVDDRCRRYVAGERSRLDRAVRALADGDVVALGPLMTESHTALSRELRIATKQVDATVAAALGAGALGARMIGAGFGGSVLTLVPRGLEHAVVDAATDTAARAGFPPPRPLHLETIGRVRRLR
jgi:galactokinase